MANPTANVTRRSKLNYSEVNNHLPAQASNHLFPGGALSRDSNGDVGHLAAGEAFAGFCTREVDNSAGAAAAKQVPVLQRGCYLLDVTGVDDDNDVGSTVYATDGDTFTLTSSGAVAIGKVQKWHSGSLCWVKFEAAELRSI